MTKADFLARKGELETYLTANEDKEEIPEADMRASLTVPVADRVWKELVKAAGIT